MENCEKPNKKSIKDRLEGLRKVIREKEDREMTPEEENNFKEMCENMGLEGDNSENEDLMDEIHNSIKNKTVVTLTVLANNGKLETVENIIIEDVDKSKNKIFVTYKGTDGIVKDIELELSNIKEIN